MENVDVMENVPVILDSEEMHVNVESVKELQLHALDMENVNVMEIVLVIKDGQTQSQLFKSVIVQQNVQETAMDMEHVNAESVHVMQDGDPNLIVDVLMNVQQNVMKIKPVHVMEPVLVFLDSMEILVHKFQNVQTLLIVLFVWEHLIVDGVTMQMFVKMFFVQLNVEQILSKIHVGLSSSQNVLLVN